MLKIIFYDLFLSDDGLKNFLKLVFKFALFFFFTLGIYGFKYYVSKNLVFENYNIFFFMVCYISSFFINYNPQRILRDTAIHKNFFYKFVFMVFNFLLSCSSIFYISALVVFETNIFNCITNYCLLLFSIMASLCFEKKLIIKISFLIINCFVISSNNNFIKSGAIIMYAILYFCFYKKCFDEYEKSMFKDDLIERTYNKNITTTFLTMEWIFIVREKKSLLFTSFFCSCGILFLFGYLSRSNPEVLCDLKNVRLLLLLSFVTGSFCTICGPYLMNWFYFYADDFLCKNWSIKNIVKGKIDFLKIITLCLFIIFIPFIILFKLNFLLMFYFFVMNISISILISVLIGITEISKIDTTKSPRLPVEKGSIISTYIPWICELIPVFIFKILYGTVPVFGIVIFSIIVFGIIHLINEKIIERFVLLISKKIGGF